MKGKRYQAAEAIIDASKTYSLEEAVELAKKTAKTKFDASIEAHFRLGINLEKTEQQVRGVVVLPHGVGKSKKVAAFVESGREEEAKKAGADLVGGEELLAEIVQSGKCDFDIAIATPAMMPKMAKAAKVLGPKGLMPNPKNETVTNDIAKAVGELKKGKILFKNDQGGNVHALIGKASFESTKLVENLRTFLDALKRVKPPGIKGIYIQTATVNAAMSPSIKLSIA
ncbi:MAG: 50S ribosomal protein L1 [Patescibacteria group bacterium]